MNFDLSLINHLILLQKPNKFEFKFEAQQGYVKYSDFN